MYIFMRLVVKQILAVFSAKPKRFGGFPLADNYSAGRLTGIVNMHATSRRLAARGGPSLSHGAHASDEQSQPTAACRITPHPALYR